MQRLADLATISAANRTGFDAYLADSAFKEFADIRLSPQQRTSLATLASPRPEGIGLRTIDARLYDLRHRFNDALRELRQAHEAFSA